MAERVDSLVYACDIDSSLESPYLLVMALGEKGLSLVAFIQGHIYYAPATALRLRWLGRMAMISSLGPLTGLVLSPDTDNILFQ